MKAGLIGMGTIGASIGTELLKADFNIDKALTAIARGVCEQPGIGAR